MEDRQAHADRPKMSAPIARAIDARVNDNMLAAHARQALTLPSAGHGKGAEIQITPEVIRCWVSKHSGVWEIPVDTFLEQGREHTALLGANEEHVSLQALCRWVQKTGIDFEFEGQAHLITFTDFHEHGDDQCGFDFCFEPDDEELPEYTCLVLVPQSFAFRIGDADTTVGFEERGFLDSSLAVTPVDWQEEVFLQFRNDLTYRAEKLCKRVTVCRQCHGESMEKKRLHCQSCGGVGAVFVTDHYEFGGAHVAPDEIATAYKATRYLESAVKGDAKAYVDFMRLCEEVQGFHMLEAITDVAFKALAFEDRVTIADAIGSKWAHLRPTERHWIWQFMKAHDIGLFADGAEDSAARDTLLSGPAGVLDVAMNDVDV